MLIIPERFQPGLSIVYTLQAHGFKAYLCGGVVRDLLMGREPKDLDIVTSATPEQVKALFPQRFISVGEQFGVVMILHEELEEQRSQLMLGHRAEVYQVATFRKDKEYEDGRRPVGIEFADEEQDAQRRDFTINALFYDPIAHRLIDYTGGQNAIRVQAIACVGDPYERFREDRLRMLRAIRFAVELDFGIAPRTYDAIRLSAGGILDVSQERIREELSKILTSPRRRQGLTYLLDTGLMKEILPEIVRLDGIPQPREFHPEGDVLIHTLMVVEELYNPSFELAMAGLLHDIGKPDTLVFADRIRFNGHDELGAKMTEEICHRMKLSVNETERIVSLVADHLRPKDLPTMHLNKVKRFLSRPYAEELLELHRADRQSSNRDLAAYHFAMEVLADMKANPPRLQLITGKDLIAMGFEPGPVFGTMLRAVEAAQDRGDLSSFEDAHEFVRTQFGGG